MQTETTTEEIQIVEYHDPVEAAVGGGVDTDHHTDDPTNGWFEVDVAPAGSKCDHGVYIAAGDTTARHCGLCNPDTYTDRILLATMARRKPTNRIYPDSPLMDAADFMEQNPGARIASVADYGDAL